MNNTTKILKELIELSDLIDRREYEDDWEEKAQEMITKIYNLVKDEQDIDYEDRGVPSLNESIEDDSDYKMGEAGSTAEDFKGDL